MFKAVHARKSLSSLRRQKPTSSSCALVKRVSGTSGVCRMSVKAKVSPRLRRHSEGRAERQQRVRAPRRVNAQSGVTERRATRRRSVSQRVNASEQARCGSGCERARVENPSADLGAPPIHPALPHPAPPRQSSATYTPSPSPCCPVPSPSPSPLRLFLSRRSSFPFLLSSFFSETALRGLSGADVLRCLTAVGAKRLPLESAEGAEEEVGAGGWSRCGTSQGAESGVGRCAAMRFRRGAAAGERD